MFSSHTKQEPLQNQQEQKYLFIRCILSEAGSAN